MTHEEMAVKIQQVEDRSKSNTKRLDEIDKKLEDNDQMLASIARLDQRQKDMDGDIKEIKTDVKSLTGKAGKRWDSVIEKTLLTVVAIIVAYIFSKIGIG
ncbi:MAG: hypothetical protein IJZ89_08650 [Clostridia bacterium]|nr:hypothetical protein [Clostridia bacterium]